MSTGRPILSFYGDDFTGSTDALELLALAGLRTRLFTRPPEARLLDLLDAFGVAGTTRAMSPGEMTRTLTPAMTDLREIGTPIVHYKVCSTFDSSPTVGSIGRVIELGLELFGQKAVPLVVGAPSLGRYCVFGNLFARCGSESEPYRLDRHPSMSRHPVTPMNESDLRVHLSRQTRVPVGLVDVLAIDAGSERARQSYDTAASAGGAVLIDHLSPGQSPVVGELIDRAAEAHRPLWVIGSSGVESALLAYWQHTGRLPAQPPIPRRTTTTRPAPLLVLAGSCSPVTAAQIAAAVSAGFAEVALDMALSIDAINAVSDQASRLLREGRSVVVHTGAGRGATPSPLRSEAIGLSLGQIAWAALDSADVRRVLIAGGDTSGQIARALEVESLDVVGPLVRGAPLCRATAPGSPADGVEMIFKGGQIGHAHFFDDVRTAAFPAAASSEVSA